MKSVLFSLIGTAILCAVCGCKPQPCVPVVVTPTPSQPGGPLTGSSGSDQPIKGHDGRPSGGKVKFSDELVHIDVIDLDATGIPSASDKKIREVDVIATDSKTIRLTNVLIDGILYGVAKREIDTPWTITLHDANPGHGIVVTGYPSTGSTSKIVVTILDKTGVDYFDYTLDKTTGIATYSLVDTTCSTKSCDIDSITVLAPPSPSVDYTCGDTSDQSTCAIDIGMQRARKQQ